MEIAHPAPRGAATRSPSPAVPAVDTPGSADSSVPAARQHFSPVPQADSHASETGRVDNGPVVWRVQCGDLIGRERCMTVYVDSDEVVLVGPPGETARLTGTQLGQLRAALGEAARLAGR